MNFRFFLHDIKVYFRDLPSLIMRPFWVTQWQDNFDLYLEKAKLGNPAEEKYINTTQHIAAELSTHNRLKQEWNAMAFGIAIQHEYFGNYQKAAHYYKQVLPDSRHYAQASFTAGNLYWNILNNDDQAIECFQRAKTAGLEDAAIPLQFLLLKRKEKDFKNRQRYYHRLRIPIKQIPSATQQFFEQRVSQYKTIMGEYNHMQPTSQSQQSNTMDSLPTLEAIKISKNDEQSPAHLKEFNKIVSDDRLPMQHSEFYMSIKDFVTNYRKRLEKDKPWFYHEIWNIRLKDLESLEAQLAKINSQNHFNDADLLILCQHLAKQPTSIFFGRSELPTFFAILTENAGKGNIKIHLRTTTDNLKLNIDKQNLINTLSEEKENNEKLQRQCNDFENRIRQKESDSNDEKINHEKEIKTFERRILDIQHKHDEEIKKREESMLENTLQFQLTLAKHEELIKSHKEELIEKEKQRQEEITRRQEEIIRHKEELTEKEKQHQTAIKEMLREYKADTEKLIKEHKSIYVDLQKQNNTLQDLYDILKKENLENVKLVTSYKAIANTYKDKAIKYDQYVGSKNYQPNFFEKPAKITANIEVPDYLLCPLSLELMTDPVVTSNGYTFDRKSITEWLEIKSTCPMSGVPIEKRLIPNDVVKNVISDWLQANANASKACVKPQESDNIVLPKPGVS